MGREGQQRILALALVAGCGGGASADGGSDTSGAEPTTLESTTTTTGDPSNGLCVPGYEGCPCFDDDRCISGFECLSNHCVAVPDATSTGDTTSDGSSSATTESGTGDEADATSSSGDESSSTGIPAVCVEDDTYCDEDDGELQTCVDGQWQYLECADACEAVGYLSDGCADADRCNCVGHGNTLCDNASYQHCICIDALYGVVSCTSMQQESEYQACIAEETPANTCWSTYQVQTIEDCEMAVAECGA